MRPSSVAVEEVEYEVRNRIIIRADINTYEHFLTIMNYFCFRLSLEFLKMKRDSIFAKQLLRHHLSEFVK
jgi:hypothetical protein